MLEIVFTIIAFVTGLIIGWILKSRTIPVINDNSDELRILNNRLIDSEKRESVANTKLSEIENRIKEEKVQIEKVHLEMKNTFKLMASDIVKDNSEEFLRMASDKFNSLQKFSEKHLDEKKKLIDQNLEGMNTKLDNISKQSTELKTSIEENKLETGKLRDTTGKLREILSSSQQRGQWGERMVEDILQFIGLIEHINYKKQMTVSSGEKPDYTFFLPKEKYLNMDVKFPLDHYKKLVDTNNEFEKENEKIAFLKDVKNHVKSVASKSYIDTTSGTLDYVLLFIPNESIYSFINKEKPSLINFALEKRVLLCSPLTLYAVLSLIHQATRNFAMEKQTEEVLKLLESFRLQWVKYTEKMDTLGRSIESTKKNYEQLITTRTNQLEKTFKNIEDLNQPEKTLTLD